jgi:Domain of unknown function DUF29
MIERRLTKTPSLKPELVNPDFWQECWADAARIAENETGILNVFPETCPWDFQQIINPEFWPGS